MTELTFVKESMLIKQVHQKSVMFVVFLNYSLKFQPNVCSRCDDLLMMSVNLSDIAILNIAKMRLQNYCKILI